MKKIYSNCTLLCNKVNYSNKIGGLQNGDISSRDIFLYYYLFISNASFVAILCCQNVIQCAMLLKVISKTQITLGMLMDKLHVCGYALCYICTHYFYIYSKTKI
uniref:Uncharacterized protein n=1 Tax=Octopus bimaculoides TaxID=37653 RepID=A0A0L8HC87_OCTBM